MIFGCSYLDGRLEGFLKKKLFSRVVPGYLTCSLAHLLFSTVAEGSWPVSTYSHPGFPLLAKEEPRSKRISYCLKSTVSMD